MYLLNGVKFDGVKQGVLLEAKGPGYVNFIEGPDRFKDWFRKEASILEQARRQETAASGIPIEWHVAEAQLAAVLRSRFEARAISKIRIVHTPAN